MRLATCLLVLAVCACDASIGGGVRSGPDASESGGGGDDSGGGGGGGGGGAADDAGVDASACPSGRVLYLNFDGQALTDAVKSDSTMNLASWMTIASGTAPPYRAGDPDRAAKIQAIVDGLRAQLAPYPITVVTTRPASGPYMMFVWGGVAQQVGSRFGGAVQELDCGDLTKNDVAWFSDNIGSTQRNVNFAMGAIGFGLGLTATTDPQGCMCGWDNAADCDNTVPCKLSTNIARDPNANQLCPGLTTQNEVEAFATGFCQ
jgi:hypothetical protein